MPLINGLKMACEPCIRGHRSTKCTHANERLMVPVRKPGRPLSACPHNATQPCTCGTVTAAIPRRQKCSCGPPSTTAAAPSSKVATANGSNGLSSPPLPTGSNGFRVTKPSKSHHCHKPSIDLTSLERMDPNQVNVLPAPNGSSTTTHHLKSEDTSEQTQVVTLHGPVVPRNPAIDTHQTEPSNQHQPTPSSDAPALAIAPHDTAIPSQSLEAYGTTQDAPKSCCGGTSGREQGANSSARRDSSDASTNSLPTSSAHSPNSSTSSAPPQWHPFSPSHGHNPNGVMVPPFPTPIMMPPPALYPFFAPHPTVYTYPAQYGSYMQPLQLEQWRQFMSAMNFFQPAQNTPYEMPAGTTLPYSAAGQPATGTSHECACGKGCQCVGCAAHPYNEATQNYVRSAWQSMIQESHGANGQTNGIDGSNALNGTHHLVPSASDTPVGTEASTPTGTNKEEPLPSTAPETPSDAMSSIGEEQQQLSANDFFFVSYPFDNGCAGDTASCPCGDDCQCIGCVIHGNPPTADTEPDNHTASQ